MCIIAIKPAGVKISNTKLFNMWMNNPHGAGFMYAKDGKLVTVKGLMTFPDLLTAYQSVQDEKVVLHYRWRTHGLISKRLTHPFMVNDNIGMVHNGVIPRMQATRKESDTSVYARLLKERAFDPMTHLDDLENRISTLIEVAYSRLVFMNGDGKIRVVNSQMGHWKDDCWYSNHSYIAASLYDKRHGMADYDPKNWKVSARLLDL